MKKVLSIMLAMVLCLGTVAFADEEIIGGADEATEILVDSALEKEVPIKLIADNKVIDTPTHIVNNRTLVPLRALLESTNATVDWDNPTQTATVKRGDKVVKVQIGNSVMNTASGDVTLDAAPVLLNEGTTTYVPLRAICEAFDFTVDWDNGGSNTILVLSPDGCHYVDMYDGITLEGYLTAINSTAEDFTLATGVDYESNKDKLYAEIDNLISIQNIANMNGYALADMLSAVGKDAAPETPWGEFIGNLTMKQYIENFTPALQYGMDAKAALESMKASYGLGDEYTLDTPYKYLRVIMDEKDLEFQKQQAEIQAAQQKAQEEKLAKDLEELPGLLKNTVKFTITMSDGKKMKGELYPDLAPTTVDNFIKLCNEKFYDGLIFHRVIDGFMLQGGGFDKDFNQKEASAIPGEFYANGFTNALKHEKGVLSMARTNDPNSASSQFFIIDETSPHLDGQYAAFGKITEGLDVVEEISKVETTTNDQGHSDVPVKPVVIKSIRIDK